MVCLTGKFWRSSVGYRAAKPKIVKMFYLGFVALTPAVTKESYVNGTCWSKASCISLIQGLIESCQEIIQTGLHVSKAFSSGVTSVLQ